VRLLLFNTLSRFIIAFFLRCMHLLIMFTSLLKDMISDIPDGREAQSKICGRGHGASMPPARLLSPNPHVFINPKAL